MSVSMNDLFIWHGSCYFENSPSLKRQLPPHRSLLTKCTTKPKVAVYTGLEKSLAGNMINSCRLGPNTHTHSHSHYSIVYVYSTFPRVKTKQTGEPTILLLASGEIHEFHSRQSCAVRTTRIASTDKERKRERERRQ